MTVIVQLNAEDRQRVLDGDLQQASVIAGSAKSNFTNSGSRDDRIPIVRRHAGTGERQNGQFVRRSAARDG